MALLALHPDAGRLVGGHQRSPGPLHEVFDVHAEVGASGDAFHGLADHRFEAAVDAVNSVEEILDAAVAADRDVEAFMAVTAPADVEIVSAGFDVVEVSHDDRVGWQNRPTRTQLPRN